MPSHLEARFRHANYYLTVWQRAEQLYISRESSRQQGLAHYLENQANIEQAFKCVATQCVLPGAKPAVLELCIAYSVAALTLLTRQFPATRAIDWLQAGLQAARTLGKKNEEWQLLTNLANIYLIRGNTSKAIPYLETCLEIAQNAGKSGSEACGIVYGQLSTAYYTLNDIPKVIAFAEKQHAVAKQLGKTEQLSATLGNLGRAHRVLQKYDEAIRFLSEAAELNRNLKNRHGESTALGSLAQVYFDTGKFSLAITTFKDYLQIARGLGDRHNEITALSGLAHAYHADGHTAWAIEVSSEALLQARQTNIRREEARICGTLGYFYFSSGLTEKARDFYLEAVALAEETEDRQLLVSTQMGLAAIHMQTRHYRTALEQYDHLLEDRFADQIRPFDKATLLLNACLCLVNLGKAGAALAYAQRAEDLGSAIGEAKLEKARQLITALRDRLPGDT